MPTRDRRPQIPLALHCFLNQDYPDRALFILDDGNDSIQDLIPHDPRITYLTGTQPPHTLGSKLNTLIHATQAPICINWDDDDWSAPQRISDQLNRLLKSKLAVTGYNAIYYLDETTHTTHRWAWPRPTPYALGTSACYYRAWGLRHPHRDITRGCDSDFSLQARLNKQLTCTDAGQLMVARYHQNSHWQHPLRNLSFPTVSPTELPKQFWQDLANTATPPQANQPPNPTS